jgi:pseudaminic acid cytidylyltransferase
MSAVAIIPARGGSQRIPGKNKKLFHGKPIICYSIETAKKSGLFDRILVSTDDPEIGAIAEAAGAEYIHRPPEWAHNDVGTQEVAQYIAREVIGYWEGRKPEFLAVIYPTAPLMCAADLKRGLLILKNAPVSTSKQYPPRNSFSRAWCQGHDSGQFYFGKYASYVMGVPLEGNALEVRIHPARDCDINLPEDWARCELMFAKLQEERKAWIQQQKNGGLANSGKPTTRGTRSTGPSGSASGR